MKQELEETREFLTHLIGRLGNWDIYFEQLDPKLFRKTCKEWAEKANQLKTKIEDYDSRAT